MNELIYLTIFLIGALAIGMTEKYRLNQRTLNIPDRILVNGIRGKSTVTRLVTGILKEDGRRVAGKTTGTSPRLFYWTDEEETPIIRSLQGPNISEQKYITREIKDRELDSLVTECMAVNPDYQLVFQKSFVKAGITIITNVMEDHLDSMGPTVHQIAEAFAQTIPTNGTVIMPPTDYERFFQKEAEKKGSRLVIADPSQVDDVYLEKFPYMMFAENVALGLALADEMNIDHETALAGMLNAPVDPGAMIVHAFGDEKRPNMFYNGFAANDATSTLNIWERIANEGSVSRYKTVVMNCRDDRVDRTIQFAEDVLPHIDADELILTGRTVKPILTAHEEGKLPFRKVTNMERMKAEETIDYLQTLPKPLLIYGIGNIHGGGEELTDEILDLSLETSASKKNELSSYTGREYREGVTK